MDWGVTQKLRPLFFRDFFQRSVDAFYQHFKFKAWKGFRVWATDGTGFRLPDAPGLGGTFGWHDNQRAAVPSTRLIGCFDVLNKVVTRLVFHPRTTAEIVLLTTLIDKKRYEYQHFACLYNKRWGIETAFFVIKSLFQLPSFSSIKPNLCWAGIYSHFILYNIQTASFKPLKKQIQAINYRRRLDYQPNRNISVGLLKRYLIRFMLGNETELEAQILSYQSQILRNLEPLRPNKNKVRKRR